MSYLLPHLRTGYAVDQAILSEEDRVVVIRFGHDWDPVCMQVRAAGDVVTPHCRRQLRLGLATPSCRAAAAGPPTAGGWGAAAT